MVAGAAIVFGACGGGDTAATDSEATATPAADAAASEAAAPAAAAPITGTMHEIKMIGDEKGYRFEPADITINSGDGITFTMVSGGPHNVAFPNPEALPEAARTALLANMPEQMGELSGKMLLTPGETYVISFAGVPAGTYDYDCTPHLAMNMKGKITVQ